MDKVEYQEYLHKLKSVAFKLVAAQKLIVGAIEDMDKMFKEIKQEDN